MTAQAGFDCLLQVDLSPTPVTIGGLRTNTMTINNAPVDITSKSTAKYRTLLESAGTRSLDISADGVFDDDAAYEAVRAAAFANTHLDLIFVLANGDKVEGEFMVASKEFGAAYEEARTYTMSFQSTGSYTYTAA